MLDTDERLADGECQFGGHSAILRRRVPRDGAANESRLAAHARPIANRPDDRITEQPQRAPVAKVDRVRDVAAIPA